MYERVDPRTCEEVYEEWETTKIKREGLHPLYGFSKNFWEEMPELYLKDFRVKITCSNGVMWVNERYLHVADAMGTHEGDRVVFVLNK